MATLCPPASQPHQPPPLSTVIPTQPQKNPYPDGGGKGDVGKGCHHAVFTPGRVSSSVWKRPSMMLGLPEKSSSGPPAWMLLKGAS